MPTTQGVESKTTTTSNHPTNTNNDTSKNPSPPANNSNTKSTAPSPNKTVAQVTASNAASYAYEFDDDDEDEDEEDDDEEEEKAATLERIEAGVPDQVVGNRSRAPSALSLGGETDDEEEGEVSHTSAEMDESTHSEGDIHNGPGEDHVTSLAEKQSLLVLAAEHDRVDILNSVLSDTTQSSAGNGDNEEQEEDIKHQLLHGGIPPLHIAIWNGSTNTATCLLRMGADPSIRPNVQQIMANQDPKQAPIINVPKQIDGLTAWELAFDSKSSKKLSAAKQQGLLNAFSAEALRCMGSDEGERLQQLLDAGMPPDMKLMGDDKSLYDWAVELGAPQCEEVLRPSVLQQQQENHETANAAGQSTAEEKVAASPLSGGKSAVLDRPGSEETAEQMTRQLEELESLAKALSTCLDSLAEEVSVSHGLLLMGGGASALAAHVRSLKSLKEQKMQELSRHQEAFENAQDELDYWVQQAGPRGQAVAAEEAPASVQTGGGGVRKHSPPPQFASVEEEAAYCDTLHERIVATHEKIRKFRVSIADLSEENDRNMQEVEKRGLTGGINLVRGLKDEIREIEFALDETKLADAVYRAKIEKIQSLLSNPATNGGAAAESEETSVAGTSKASTEHHFNHGNGTLSTSRSVPLDQESGSFSDVESEVSSDGMKPSEKIATGHSTAIVVRSSSSGPGSFPLSLWQILLRIIGLRDNTSSRAPAARTAQSSSPSRPSSNSYNSQPAMIV